MTEHATSSDPTAAVVRQVEEAREQLEHRCARAEAENFGYITVAAGHLRTLLDALSAAEGERDRAERREGELREALEPFKRAADVADRGYTYSASWPRPFTDDTQIACVLPGMDGPMPILSRDAKGILTVGDLRAARAALAAPAEPTEKEGGEG